VQSGSERILAEMKRSFDLAALRAAIGEVRAQARGTRVYTHFIVGFPGETDEDFEHTMQLIEQVDFDHSFSFIYSQRPGTPAADLPDDVPMAVKQARLQRLQQAINSNAQRFSRQMVGTVQKVLVDRPARKNPEQISGRTENNRVVNFDGPAELIGQFAEVLIT